MMNYEEEFQKNTAERVLCQFNDAVEKHQNQTSNFINEFSVFPLSSQNVNLDSIELKFEPCEYISLDQLVKSDNKLVNKVILTLVAVCKEMLTLSHEAEYDLYTPIILYESSATKDDVEISLTKILPILQKINNYVKRVYKVTQNVVQQLSALYPKEKKLAVISAYGAHFQVVFEYIGKLFATLISFDELLSNSPTLQSHWMSYKQLIKSSINDPNSLETNTKDLFTLQKFLNEIENTIMRNNIFKNLVSMSFNSDDMCVSKNSSLRDEMTIIILGWCSQIDQGSNDYCQSECSRQTLALCSLFVFHHFLFDTEDKKIGKAVISILKKYPCIVIGGYHVWIAEKYLVETFPSLSHLFHSKNIDAFHSNRISYLTQRVQTISNDVSFSSSQINTWCVQLNNASKKHVSKFSKQDLNRRILLFIQGIVNAYHLRDTVESILSLHTALGRPMTKACAISLCKMLETLKAIEITFYQEIPVLAESIFHFKQFLSYQILSLLKGAKNRLCNQRDLDNQRLDAISAFTISMSALSGCDTKDRLLVSRVALSLVNQRRFLNEEELTSLLILLKRIDLINGIQRKFNRATETAFLYHHRILIPIYMENYFQNHFTPGRIHNFLLAVNDCMSWLNSPHNLPHREKLIDSLISETEDTLHKDLLDRICKELETDLRLSSHNHLNPDTRNSFSNGITYLQPLLNLKPLFIFGRMISIREYVEHYLERTFYNLGVLAPHDCATYELMHHLAFTKYGLTIVPSHLPSRIIDQAVDILDIMRNINVFVKQYHYNLNQQFFIEFESNSKHLNVVAIKDIANSIKTHGSGIINTTINYTYQFLKQKFNLFSQFLYDEQIKSRLLKDNQYWKELKNSQKFYPYERAEKFNRGIKKLGLSHNGLSYLDRFRQLITLTGNAIGYVRLIRTAKLRVFSSCSQLILDADKIVSFSDLCEGGVLSEYSKESAKNLDDVISNLTEAFHQDTDYFQLMVNVFSTVLNQPKNSHFQSFFLLVPPLTINYIEYILASKENLSKKHQSGCTFTEDGFSLGIAYLLQVLNQNDAFKALHWWSAIKKRFIQEKKKIKEQSETTINADKKLQQTLSLAMSRLVQFEKEFELLHLNVSSSQVLFKGTNGHQLSNIKEGTTVES